MINLPTNKNQTTKPKAQPKKKHNQKNIKPNNETNIKQKTTETEDAY